MNRFGGMFNEEESVTTFRWLCQRGSTMAAAGFLYDRAAGVYCAELTGREDLADRERANLLAIVGSPEEMNSLIETCEGCEDWNVAMGCCHAFVLRWCLAEFSNLRDEVRTGKWPGIARHLRGE